MDRPSEIPSSTPEPPQQSRRTLTHLVVGVLAFGFDTLTQRLEAWDGLAAPQQVDDRMVTPATQGEAPIEGAVLLPESEEQPADTARYALVGLLFNAQDRIDSGFNRADRLTRRLYASSARLIEPITNSPLATPFASRWQRLVQRGELQVSNWVERGRVEEQTGVVIARQAVEGTTGEVIDVLADHPGIRELVEKQSTGFATEIVEEIRERTVSLDTLFERVTRRILRKPKRPLLAPPAAGQEAEAGTKTRPPGIRRL